MKSKWKRSGSAIPQDSAAAADGIVRAAQPRSYDPRLLQLFCFRAMFLKTALPGKRFRPVVVIQDGERATKLPRLEVDGSLPFEMQLVHRAARVRQLSAEFAMSSPTSLFKSACHGAAPRISLGDDKSVVAKPWNSVAEDHEYEKQMEMLLARIAGRRVHVMVSRRGLGEPRFVVTVDGGRDQGIVDDLSRVLTGQPFRPLILFSEPSPDRFLRGL